MPSPTFNRREPASATLGARLALAILAVLFDQIVSCTGGPNGLLGVKLLRRAEKPGNRAPDESLERGGRGNGALLQHPRQCCHLRKSMSLM
jgi:hypothetical protein